MQLKRLGFEPVSMLEGKVPAEKWAHLYNAPRTIEEIAANWRNAFGIAIITREPIAVIDVDADDREKLAAILKRCGLEGAPVCITPSGGAHAHGLLRKGVERSRTIKVHGDDVDLLVGRSLSILPPTPGYTWLADGLPDIGNLPKCKVSWTRERTKKRAQVIIEAPTGEAEIRARAYLATIPGAVSGQRGHNCTFRVACILVQRFGLTIPQAWPLFVEWNEKCEPPWNDGELLHKLEDAEKKKR